jgi:hypothetical protein
VPIGAVQNDDGAALLALYAIAAAVVALLPL